jgi:hypothetical protein
MMVVFTYKGLTVRDMTKVGIVCIDDRFYRRG